MKKKAKKPTVEELLKNDCYKLLLTAGNVEGLKAIHATWNNRSSTKPSYPDFGKRVPLHVNLKLCRTKDVAFFLARSL